MRTVDIYDSREKAAVTDIWIGMQSYPVWGLLAIFDIVSRYRQTMIGPFWQTLTIAIFIGALSVVYSALFKIEIRTYIPYLTAGLLPWMLISSIVIEGCVAFIEGGSIIKNSRVPLSIFVFRVALRNTIVFFHHVPVLVFVLLVFEVPFGWSALLSVVGLGFVWINAIWVIIVLGILATRYRDIQQLVAILLQVAFLITPVLWSPTSLDSKRLVLVEGNIFYHFVEIVRAPLLGTIPPLSTYLVIITTTVVGWALSIVMYSHFRKRVAYWL